MDTIKVFEDSAKEWRWRRTAANGEVVSDSAEGYTRKDDAVRAAHREAQYGDRVVVPANDQASPEDQSALDQGAQSGGD